MGILAEFNELRKSIFNWLYVFLAFSGFFFLFGLKEVEIFGTNIFLPLPAARSFSSRIFEMLQKDLLPSGVRLIVTNPLAAFLAQCWISAALAFLVSFPLLVYKIAGYLSPALYDKERKAAFKILFPAIVLFAIGCLFGYFVLIPPTFKILYSYAQSLGAVQFFSVSEFIGSVFGLAITTGVLFLLPVFMVLLTNLGVVNSDFWRKNWRYALLIFLIFSAIITPDGSGITMLLLSAPMTGLYGAGMLIARIKNRQ